MRRRRSETTAILRRVRGALLWAVACSAAAGVCLLALPLLAALVFAPSQRLASPIAIEDFAALAAFAVTALSLAVVFASARTRLLSRASLWTEHALGYTTLIAGLDAAQSPNDLDQDRQAVTIVAAGIRASAGLCGLAMGLAPLLFVFVYAPLLGLLSVLSVGALVGVAAVRIMRGTREASRTADARAIADGVWRTAAASSVVIAARGLTVSTAKSWRTAHARALGRAFQTSEADARAVAMTHAAIVVSGVAFAVVALWQVRAGVMAAAVAAAAGVAHALVLLPLDRLQRVVPLLVEARRALDHLAREVDGLLMGSMANPGTPSTLAAAARPQPSTQRYAEAS